MVFVAVVVVVALYAAYYYWKMHKAPPGVRRVVTDLRAPISFDIDAVVTYVDCSDPEWQERKRAALGAAEMSTLDVRSERYNGTSAEVCTCLTLMLRNMPWLRRVHVVAMRPQVPACLRPGGSLHGHLATGRIAMVYHDQIFAADHPKHTFDSCAIESRLHYIPGLAETFLYSNDDMYVLKPLPPSLFFTPEGLPIADDNGKWLYKTAAAPFVAPFLDKHTQSYHHALYKVMQGAAPAIFHREHHVFPVTRSIMARAQEAYPEEWDKTSRNLFRSSEVMPVLAVAQTHALLTQDAVLGHYPLAKAAVHDDGGLPRNIRANIHKQKYDMLCLNNLSPEEQETVLPALLDDEQAQI